MADQSTNINYSFEDIQRYVSGRMPAAEMHALEKAALQDAFLADAIEGYNNADAQTTAKHINEINASLNKEDKESLLFSLKRKTNWWRVAAIIFLIFGVGVLSDYVFKRMNTHQEIAQVKVNDATALKQSKNGAVENDSDQQTITNIELKEADKQPSTSKAKADSSITIKKENQNNDVVMNDKAAASSNQTGILKDETAKSYSRMAAPKPDIIQPELQGKVAGVETKNLKRAESASKDLATPVGGWDNFNNYVAEELNKDSLFQTNNSNNFVEIEFLVDDKGNPYNLKIIKLLDERSNEKAMDILSSGPKWTTNSKLKKAKVKISF